MSNMTIKDYQNNTSIDSANDYFLGQQNSTGDYRKYTRNSILGVTGQPADINSTQTLSNKVIDNSNTITVKDTNFIIQDDGDITRQAKFQLSSITAGQTRTYTLPDATGTIVDTATAQTLSNKTLTAPVINNGSIYNTSINTTAATITSLNSTNIAATNATITNLTIGSQSPSVDWTAIATTPNTVTYNGQRSYSLVFNGVNYSNIFSSGQRVRTTRTVAAPTQCTSLNGSSQYWSKTNPNKLTFTDDFVVDAYVKLTSYAAGGIISRLDANQGFQFIVNASGQVLLTGFNGGLVNYSYVQSYQSLPLNKWVRVTAQLDMSAFTATTTTSYIMIDGVDVPASVIRAGSNPTALVQAGTLNIGAINGASFFPGKIAQFAIYNAKVTQANIILTHSQGLTGSETSLASAYSFNGVATDLNTTTPNDLTAQASAGYVADSPFGTQADGSISSTIDYAISMSVSTDGLTEVLQVPEGCTIPTSGGVSAIAYSGLKAPYGFPVGETKWAVVYQNLTTSTVVTPGAGIWYNSATTNISATIPVGSWRITFGGVLEVNYAASATNLVSASLSTANNTSGGVDSTISIIAATVAGAPIFGSTSYLTIFRNYSSATVVYLNLYVNTTPTNIYLNGGTAPTLIIATNALL